MCMEKACQAPSHVGTCMYFCSAMKADGWMFVPKAIPPLPPCNRHWVSLPPSLEGVVRAKCEHRSHPSPQDVINLPSQHLFSSGFWLSCLGFSFIICCVSSGTGLQAVVPAGRAAMGVDARKKGEAALCALP